MNEIGIDVTKHAPRSLADLHDTTFDLIITLSPEAHHQALELTRTMAVDLTQYQIRVNCVAPAHIQTGMTSYDMDAVIRFTQP